MPARPTRSEQPTARVAVLLLLLGTVLAVAPTPAAAQVDLGYQVAWSDYGNHYLVNVDGTDNRRVGTAEVGEFDWSPDGLKLVYREQGGQMVLQNQDGATFPIDLPHGGGFLSAQLAPGGEMIAYHDQVRANEYTVFIIDLQGNLLGQIEDARDPAWSPDGTRMAFVRRGEHTIGCEGDTRPEPETSTITSSGIAVASVDGIAQGGIMNPAASWVVEPGQRITDHSYWHGASEPRWSPDGTTIAYTGSYDIRRFDPDRGPFGGCGSSCWDPDAICLTDDADILLVPATGGEPENLTEDAGLVDDHGEPAYLAAGDLHPSWSPDGDLIAFSSTRDDGVAGNIHSLWVMNADGTDQRLVHATASGTTGRVDGTDWRPVVGGAGVVRITPVDPDAGERISEEDPRPNGGAVAIQRTGRTDGDLAVQIRVSPDSTATEGVDYEPLPTTVTIPDGTDLVNVVIAPIDDDLVEGRESVIVELVDAQGHILGPPSQATVTIVDDEVDVDPELVDWAVDASHARFPDVRVAFDGGGDRPPATAAVLARGDVFADALTGSALTTTAPLLFTAGTAVDPLVLAELDRVLGGAGTVYLLGGEAALGPAVADELTEAGYTVRRLAGPSRLETAVAIAEEVVALTGGGTVALARAFAPADQPTAAWVDSVTAGAWAADSGNPILLVDGQAETLPGSVAAFLDRLDPAHVVALGGTAAVSDAVVTATGATRIGGTNRFATAVAIADGLWEAPSDERVVANGTQTDGWAYALLAAGLAADADAPVLLAETDRLPTETQQAVCGGDGLVRYEVFGPLRLVGTGVHDGLRTACS